MRLGLGAGLSAGVDLDLGSGTTEIGLIKRLRRILILGLRLRITRRTPFALRTRIVLTTIIKTYIYYI